MANFAGPIDTRQLSGSTAFGRHPMKAQVQHSYDDPSVGAP
jgi:hypothetical protein